MKSSPITRPAAVGLNEIIGLSSQCQLSFGGLYPLASVPESQSGTYSNARVSTSILVPTMVLVFTSQVVARATTLALSALQAELPASVKLVFQIVEPDRPYGSTLCTFSPLAFFPVAP